MVILMGNRFVWDTPTVGGFFCFCFRRIDFTSVFRPLCEFVSFLLFKLFSQFNKQFVFLVEILGKTVRNRNDSSRIVCAFAKPSEKFPQKSQQQSAMSAINDAENPRNIPTVAREALMNNNAANELISLSLAAVT